MKRMCADKKNNMVYIKLCFLLVIFLYSWLITEKSTFIVHAKEAVSQNEIIETGMPRIEDVSAEEIDSINGYCTAVRISVSANLAGGLLAEKGYGIAGPFTEKNIAAALQYSCEDTFLITENGWYCVGVATTEGKEVRAGIKVENIDNTAPAISSANVVMTEGINGYARSGYLSIAAYDLESGLHKAAFSFDDGNSFQEQYMSEIKENGTYPVWVRDALMNAVRRVVEVNCIDNAGPLLEYEKAEGNGCVEIRTSLQDAGAGLAAFYYVDNATMARSIPEIFDGERKESTGIKIYAAGNYTLYAEDMLGNQTARIITIDRIPPAAVEILPEQAPIVPGGLVSAVFIIDEDKEESAKAVILEKKEILLKADKTAEVKKTETVKPLGDYEETILNTLYKEETEEDEEEKVIAAKPQMIAEAVKEEVLEPAFYGLEKAVESYELPQFAAAPETIEEEEVIEYPVEAKEEEISDGSVVGLGVGIMVLFVILLVVAFVKLRLIPVKEDV